LKEVNSQSLQEVSLDLEKAYRRFFQKLGKKPRFKKKLHKQKFKVPQYFKLKKSRRGNYFLYIPKLKSGIKVKKK
jgi:putative transposase